MAIHKLFSKILLIQTYHTTCVSFSCEFRKSNIKSDQKVFCFFLIGFDALQYYLTSEPLGVAILGDCQEKSTNHLKVEPDFSHFDLSQAQTHSGELCSSFRDKDLAFYSANHFRTCTMIFTYIKHFDLISGVFIIGAWIN